MPICKKCGYTLPEYVVESGAEHDCPAPVPEPEPVPDPVPMDPE